MRKDDVNKGAVYDELIVYGLYGKRPGKPEWCEIHLDTPVGMAQGDMLRTTWRRPGDKSDKALGTFAGPIYVQPEQNEEVEAARAKTK